MNDTSTQLVMFHLPDGAEVPADEVGQRGLDEMLYSFSGSTPNPLEVLSPTETRMVQLWFELLALDQARQAGQLKKMLDMFQGYPSGTTLGDIVTGNATKTVEAAK